LDSEANRNALSSQLMTELDERLAAAIGDAAVRVVVLTAAGTVFCSGADLKEQLSANQAGRLSGPAGLVPILQRMWHSPKPIVGRINGAARAGGLGLLAACDVAVAAEGATFAVSEVRIGVIPAIISVVLLPKLGATKCMELFLSGEAIGASEAAGIGLVTASAPREDLEAAVGRYVEAILKGAPGALAGAKHLVREVPGMPMDEAFEAMVHRSAAFFAMEEAREGMAAFGEKRPPAWQA
jgi:methylglutaconyl-CoA hydratase